MRATSKYTEGIGERISAIRRSANMNQAELGEKVGLSRQMINAYENERTLPPMYMIEKISNLFEINPWWILYGVGRLAPGSGIASKLSGIIYQGGTEQELTSTQLTLINYIKSDRDAAENLLLELQGWWDKKLDERSK
ncbi:MAG: helix-turn-helix domain-containing protein [Fidelibacterota bacterium]|nr:MAG: helix-turn-helix domain-containing protein [Candidatus Neomarinimicrobiota bacterium]